MHGPSHRSSGPYWATLGLVAVMSGFGGDAIAQPLGTFRWQLLPYCNVVRLSVTANGAGFTLDGIDDQCGTSPGASVLGTAFFNPDGSVGLGLHLVVSPGAAPLHLGATLNPATLGGTWSDSGGHSGTLLFAPSGPIAGSPRPGNDGLAAVAVTAVTAGPGLLGSGGPGAVGLAVAFGGGGEAETAARSDHTHATGQGLSSTAIGRDALAGSRGTGNTAIGFESLTDNGTGDFNTAVGFRSLADNLGGTWNSAFGYQSLAGNVGGSFNTAIGRGSMALNDSGTGNTAVGTSSLTQNTTGDNNIAIGNVAGSSVTTGSGNIHIGHPGFVNDDHTIRIGDDQTLTYLAGVRTVTTFQNNAVPVLIDSSGQLGTFSSTRRAKERIADLGASAFAVQRLRPVQFQYRRPFADGSRPRQYGLIAEEVAEVLPELVADDGAGQPATVKYHVLPVLLLGEIQRLERERRTLEGTLRALQNDVAALQRQLRAQRR